MFSLIPWSKKKTRGLPSVFEPFRDMENFLDRFGVEVPDWELTATELPAFNMYREGDDLIVDAKLPGYKKDDITVELNDDVLTIKGERKEEQRKEEKDYYYREFRTGAFNRSVRLPGDVSPDKLKAKYENGILKISLPYSEEAGKSKAIPIE